MEEKEIRNAIMLGNLIKGVYRQLILASTIGAIFFSLYISMHQQSTASTNSQYEYWIIFTLFWMAMFVFGVGVVKGQQFSQLFLAFSLLILVPFFIYDCYMISLITGVHHHTFLLTTLIIRWIFWFLELCFFFLIAGCFFFSSASWKAYLTLIRYYDFYDFFDRYDFSKFISGGDDDEDEDENESEADKDRKRVEKIIKGELRGSFHRSTIKDNVMLGVIYTILPLESSSLFFYVLTLLSIDNATRSDWLYVCHLITIVVSSIWHSTDTNNISIYGLFSTSVFFVFMVDFFQLLLRRGNYSVITAMRGILCALVLLYFVVVVLRAYRIEVGDKARVLYFCLTRGLLALAVIDVFDIFNYIFYADAVFVQYIYVSPYFHVMTASVATALSSSPNDLETGWNLLFFFVSLAMGVDIFYLATWNTLHVYTQGQLAIMSFFFMTSAFYFFLLLIINSPIRDKILVQQFNIMKKKVEQKITIGLDNKKIVVSSWYMVPIFLADIITTIYYTIILVDQDILITAPKAYAQYHTRWYDWFPVVHYLVALIALGNAITAVKIHVDIALIMIMMGAFICLAIDVLIFSLAIDENTVGMAFVRVFMILIDVGYIICSAFGLYNPKYATISIPDKLSLNKSTMAGSGGDGNDKNK